MKHLILSFLALLSLNLFAEGIISENILHTHVIISSGQNKVLNLGRSYYVNHLVINAEGIGQDSMVEVLVNGVVKGTIYAPGRDPEYVVTIREVTNAIELRHLSGASMKLTSFFVFRSEDGYDPNAGGDLPIGKASVAYLANNVINLCRKFEAILTTREFEAHILPVKIVAGQLYAIASAHGDSSVKTLEKFQALHFSMGLALGLIDELLKNSKTFDLAVKYLEQKELVRELLD